MCDIIKQSAAEQTPGHWSVLQPDNDPKHLQTVKDPSPQTKVNNIDCAAQRHGFQKKHHSDCGSFLT